MRYDEIRSAEEQGPTIDFRSQEEMKRTSDRVADALYEAYIAYIAP